MSKPIIAIVGRPYVGKSTLFNALAGEKISIVKDTPGVTRDRIYADVTWLNYQFTLIDTGGIEPDSGDLLLSHMRGQAEIAMETADVIIFLTDVRQGLVDADYQVAKELAAKVITEKPFECISESAFEEALEFLGKCEKVYCPLKDFGIMNEKNRELLKKAKETGKLNQIR